MIKIKFFTTSNCHLCDDAEFLLQKYLQDQIITIDKIDIADSDYLVDLYGIRIPVIRRLDSDKELGWPFDERVLIDFFR